MIDNQSLADPESEAIEPEVAAEASGDEVGTEGPRAKLILKRSGVETDEVFEFGSPATVGRFDPAVGPIDVDLGPLEEGVFVSRKHAKLTFADGVWRIEDLGSSNGTFVLRSDFEKVDSAELADGDEVAFGNARFVFRLATDDVEPTELAADEAEASAPPMMDPSA